MDGLEFVLSGVDFQWNGEITEKVTAVMRMFGVDVGRLKKQVVADDNLKINLASGDVVFITGPSGAGKSVLMKAMSEKISDEDKIVLDDIELSSEKSVIDCIDGDLLSSLRFLSVAGLNDVFSILNQPGNLSEGQKWRFRLAMAIASKKKIIFADEFCSNLDRITAAAVAYNVSRFAKRYEVIFIVASCSDDVVADLSPDVLVVKEFSGKTKIVYKTQTQAGAYCEKT